MDHISFICCWAGLWLWAEAVEKFTGLSSETQRQEHFKGHMRTPSIMFHTWNSLLKVNAQFSSGSEWGRRDQNHHCYLLVIWYSGILEPSNQQKTYNSISCRRATDMQREDCFKASNTLEETNALNTVLWLAYLSWQWGTDGRQTNKHWWNVAHLLISLTLVVHMVGGAKFLLITRS